MKYLLLMTISGSGLLIAYLCWEKLLEKSLTQGMKYKALMAVMLVYAVPWVGLKEIYRWILISLWRIEAVAVVKGIVDIADIKTEESVYQTKEYRLWMLVLIIWFTIAIVILLVRIAKYIAKRNALYALAIECGDENLEKTMICLQKTVRYTNKPEVVWTRVNNETFTLGTIKPVIFLQKGYAKKELYWILKHEMTHIVRRDLWVKLFLEFICCLHWFNPFIYLLESKMRFLCETSCDERVIKNCTEEECRTYIELLERNKGGNKSKIPFSSALGDSDDEIEKRIVLMKEQRNIRRRKKIIAIFAFGLLVFLDSLTALAYPEIYHVKDAVIEAAEDSLGGENLWVYDCTEEEYSLPVEVVLYDEQFVDEGGQIYLAYFENEHKTRFGHDEISGIIQIHVKDSDGSCIVEVYEGARCAKCGTVWKGELLYKVRKDFCVHQAVSVE